MKKEHIYLIVLIAVVVGVGSFFAGYKYAKFSVKPADTRQFARMPGQQLGQGMRGQGSPGMVGRNGGGFAAGEVLSKDDKSLTIKLQDGGSKIVFFSASTTVSMMTDGKMDDIKQGSVVMITGSQNQDGSVTAKTVQLRPAGEVVPPMPAPQK